MSLFNISLRQDIFQSSGKKQLMQSLAFTAITCIVYMYVSCFHSFYEIHTREHYNYCCSLFLSFQKSELIVTCELNAKFILANPSKPPNKKLKAATETRET